MSYQIDKNYPADFLALIQEQPDAGVLQAQVNAAISSAECAEVGTDGSVCSMIFDVEPSAGDKTLINGIVAAHTGDPFVQSIQSTTSESVQTEGGTSYVTKASLASGLLAGGQYMLTWYCEISVTTVDLGLTASALARVMWNGSERAESSNNNNFYESFSGTIIVECAPLDAPTLSIELRRAGILNTARIRRCRLSIVPMGSEG